MIGDLPERVSVANQSRARLASPAARSLRPLSTKTQMASDYSQLMVSEPDICTRLEADDEAAASEISAQSVKIRLQISSTGDVLAECSSG